MFDLPVDVEDQPLINARLLVQVTTDLALFIQWIGLRFWIQHRRKLELVPKIVSVTICVSVDERNGVYAILF